MILTDFIARDAILPTLQASTKAEAMRILCDALFHDADPELRQTALGRALAREGTQSTGIGHGIALPHTPVVGLDRLRCGVGRMEKGIGFGSIDERPVELIFLICYPPSDQSLYLNFVATIAKLLRDKVHLDALLGADTTEALFEQLEMFSKFLVNSEGTLRRAEREAGAATEAPGTSDSELLLLARLDLCTEMLAEADSGQAEIEQRIANLSALIDPETLRQYQEIRKVKRNAIVALETGVCQGCFATLPTAIAQAIRTESKRLHRCTYCRRLLYVISPACPA